MPDSFNPLDKFCWSLYAGCGCAFDKDHEGLHECATCDETWTTEQAEQWAKDLYELGNIT